MSTEALSSPLALRPKDAARLLSLSPRTLWQLTRDGAIPAARVGNGKRRLVLYAVADLQAWLSREAQKSVPSEGGQQ